MNPGHREQIEAMIAREHARYTRGYQAQGTALPSPSERDEAETSREILHLLRMVLVGGDPKQVYEATAKRLRERMKTTASRRHVTAAPSEEHGQDRLLAAYLSIKSLPLPLTITPL